MTTAQQLQGKELSYNNINDTDAAYECIAEFDAGRTRPAIIKHANPCGVAEGADLVESLSQGAGMRSDRRPPAASSRSTGRSMRKPARITEMFTEVIIAPDASDEAMAIVAGKKNLRLLIAGGLPDPRSGPHRENRRRRSSGPGPRQAVVDDMTLKTVTKRAPTEAELRDLRFAFRWQST